MRRIVFFVLYLFAGFAEPSLYDLQTRLVQGIVAEIQADITPPAGQHPPQKKGGGKKDKFARYRRKK